MPARRDIIILISALIVTAAIMPSFSYSQESNDSPVKYVRGRIYGINWAGSKLTIQWFYSTDKLAQDKMVFTIPGNVQVSTDRGKIFKDVRSIGIADLIIGDHVIIGYRENKKKGELEAGTIKVLDHDLPIPS